MSSKNRKVKSDPFDDYPTPGWCVESFLDYYGTDRLFTTKPRQTTALEPSAGAGSIIKAVSLYRLRENKPCDIAWTAVDVQPKYAEPLLSLPTVKNIIIGDFLTVSEQFIDQRFDFVGGNPPFTYAQRFVERCLQFTDTVILLLRWGFHGSVERHEFMKRTHPDSYRIAPRPPFVNKKTDSSEYAFFEWSPSATGKVHYLEPTEAAKRRHALKMERRSHGREETA